MSLRDNLLQELRTMLKVDFGLRYDNARKHKVEGLVSALSRITDEDIDNAAKYLGVDATTAFMRLFFAEYIGIHP